MTTYSRLMEQRQEGFEDGLRQGISQGISQGLQQGISQGSHQKAVETARSMLKDKMDLSIIGRYTGLPLDEVRQLSQD